MICRAWDTHTKNGKYLSTDFIASDEKGHVIQITTKNNIAHCFIHRLKEGSVYFLSDFDVVPNKPDYRLLNDNQVMIQLQGSTRLRKQPTNDTRGFIRHPFNCIKFEALTPTNDVVGYAVNVGSHVDLKTGDTILEFDLANESGRKIKVTLWGKLGCSFVQGKSSQPAPRCIILSSVTVKHNYLGTLTLSSTSSTLVLEDPAIPVLQEFMNNLSGKDLCGDLEYCAIDIPAAAQTEGTLAELIWSSRKGKGAGSSVTKPEIFKCTVHVTNARTKLGWYYVSCGICQAKKGIRRQGGHYWYESCSKDVLYPNTRFKIQLEVTDGTGEAVVVLFDETVEKLVRATAKSLVADLDEDSPSHVLPNPIANLINTTQTLLLNAGTHYEHGSHESFNCLRVLNSAPIDIETTVTAKKDHTPAIEPPVSTPNRKKRNLAVATPAKETDRPNRRK
ncbi:replication factor A protein 1-like [Rutidosis leptorrhynchoides]|uniref:replication factor A protein 1-like n=1 Tax=Rutidosis leptorrhynchoides TaxID=125765 RepID=UPI003A994A13